MTMVERTRREREPIKAGRGISQGDVDGYISTMVRCEKMAAMKLGWADVEWAGHCLQQNASVRREGRGNRNG